MLIGQPDMTPIRQVQPAISPASNGRAPYVLWRGARKRYPIRVWIRRP